MISQYTQHSDFQWCYIMALSSKSISFPSIAIKSDDFVVPPLCLCIVFCLWIRRCLKNLLAPNFKSTNKPARIVLLTILLDPGSYILEVEPSQGRF